MKKVFIALGLAVVFNISGAAQKQQKSASFSAVSNVQAQLQNSLDVRNAKVGDQVVLKTMQSIKQDGQVVIPKGSELIGRVTEVQQRAKNGSASRLGLVFSELKNGGAITPITASIVSITNAAASASASGFDSDLSSSGSTSTRSSSGGSSGGGLLGGVTNTVGGVVDTTTQTVGSVSNTATQTVSGTTQIVGRSINGIQISSSASGSVQSSTTLSSQNNNVHLDKGVTFGLNVQKSGAN